MYRAYSRILLSCLLALAPAAGPLCRAQVNSIAETVPVNTTNRDLAKAGAALEEGRQLLRGYAADKAFTHLQTALELYTKTNDRDGIPTAQDLLGDVYALSGQYDRAFELYRKAADGFRQGGDAQAANAVLAKIGERYLLLGDLAQARAAFAAMTVSPPERSLKESGVAGLGLPRGDSKATSAGAGAAAGLAACFAPPVQPDNADPKNPPNQGVAPKTPNGAGRMDLRVTDEEGNPVTDVRAQLQSTRPDGLYCECWGSTDALGRALLPPLHIADHVKLVLRAPGLPGQELLVSAQDLAQPLRVELTQAGARLLPQPTRAGADATSGPCFDFYRALVAFGARESGTARVDFLAGRLPESRKRYEDLLAQLGIPGVEGFKVTARLRAAALTALGDIAFRENRLKDAVELYAQALERARKDNRLDLTWAAQRGLGRTYWRQYVTTPNAPQAAWLRSDAMTSYLAAVRTLEALRAGSLRADEARTAFLASTRDVYDEAAAVIAEMALIAAGPDAPAEAATKAVALSGSALDLADSAFSVIEQSRARALLDMLGEAQNGITEGVPADLLKRRGEVLARQQEIAEMLSGVMLPGEAPHKPVAELEKELDSLSAVYDALENDIRTASPRYASLAGAKPLTLAEVQQRVLDPDTALLLYDLGESASYLWVVSKEGVSVARLPERATIESKVIALRAQLIPARLRRSIAGIDAPSGATHGLVQEPDEKAAAKPAPRPGGQQASNPSALAGASFDLYSAVLKTAAQSFGGKRLVVVPDGALNFVPFEALVTEPAAGATNYGALDYLVKSHEVAYAPSASVIDAVRLQATQSRPTGAARLGGPVLVLADPVFSLTDSRVQMTESSKAAADGAGARGLTLKSAVDAVAGDSPGEGGVLIPRLAGTRVEAEEIAQLAGEAKAQADVWLDLNASEVNVDGRDLRRYSVIHFATHGLLDASHPQFTGLVLSLIGEKDEDGFLRVNEVFNYRLGAPLVMLSACETGLGRERRGEGVIGLPRAFMYAGAPTVGVSLWSVSDSSTAQLMSEFYRRLFASGGAQPSAALRKAQLKMLEDPRYSQPYYWAPFIMVGDWN